MAHWIESIFNLVGALAFLFFAILLLLLLAYPARAAQPLGPIGTAVEKKIEEGKGVQAEKQGGIDPKKLWDSILTVATKDLTYANALAQSVGTVKSKARSTCYAAIVAAKNKADGISLKDEQGNPLTKPEPDVITQFERVAELVDNLAPDSPLMIDCSAAAHLFNVSVLQMVNALVAGAAGIAALGPIK